MQYFIYSFLLPFCMKTYLLLVFVCFLVIGCTPLDQTSQQLPSTQPVDTVQQSSPTTSTSSLITLEQLRAHSQSGDCWVSYEGTVYDITEWLPLHPGGSAVIAQYCGTSSEFETAFSGKHGQQMIGQLQAQGRVVGTLN
jgi:cytochrome b involved in lipid metabolism